MNSWNYLIESGMAEVVTAETAATMIADLLAKFKRMMPNIPDSLLEIVASRCEVIRFKKDAVILEYGENHSHLFFRNSGAIKTFFIHDGRLRAEISSEHDWILATNNFYMAGSATKMVVVKDGLFVTVRWDRQEFHAQSCLEFSLIGIMTADRYQKQVMKRFRRKVEKEKLRVV
ncbi:hypothetical protein ACQKLP_17735 [Chitinophaga sp. NPDC101104]|uniref:hypothetical protein n=1 Tax=Chitinophaga sp. NPDC101104 TaxID=3390561 RepID=UPI003D07CA2B